MSDGLNDARAIRVAEIMTDFRNLQHYLNQVQISPNASEYFLQGYSLVRQSKEDARSVLSTPFSANSSVPGGDVEREKAQLRGIITDASVRRFQCQRAYLRAQAGLRWIDSRNSILGTQLSDANRMSRLQQSDSSLRLELLAITDARVEHMLRAQDASQGKWLNEDPSLAQIQHVLSRRR